MRLPTTRYVYLDCGTIVNPLKELVACLRRSDHGPRLGEQLSEIRGYAGNEFYMILTKLYCLMDLQPYIISAYMQLLRSEQYLALTADLTEQASSLTPSFIMFMRAEPSFTRRYSKLLPDRKQQLARINGTLMRTAIIGEHPHELPLVRKIVTIGVLEIIAFIAEGWAMDYGGWRNGHMVQFNNTQEDLNAYARATKLAAFRALQDERIFGDVVRAKYAGTQWYREGRELNVPVCDDLVVI